MCDCFPKNGGSIIPTDACTLKIGTSEYANNYKQWNEPVLDKSYGPDYSDFSSATSPWNQRYSFSKGARFGIPPYCDCTPPPERFRFETTYQHDFFDLNDNDCRRQPHTLHGIRPRNAAVLPRQYLCPFTTDSTYSRAFDMPQTHFKPLCAQQESCGGSGQDSCGDNDCYDPCGMTIRFSPQRNRPCVPKLRKEALIKPGTDTSQCCKCPIPISCCPCDDNKRCDACCGCEYPCKLHQATVTPTRKYPIILNTPRYVPDPRTPPRRPLLLCHGGTRECPLQNQFPTQAAIKQAKERLLDKIEQERCRFPPECIESTYRSTFKTPVINSSKPYCSREMKEAVQRANEEHMEKGMPPSCLPAYCLDGGRPPDARPMFDHLSTYEADFIWNVVPRFKMLGGEIPCGEFPIKPLCSPKVISASEVLEERTEEKERWGNDWECFPEPPEPMS